jgi:hypothetical protein
MKLDPVSRRSLGAALAAALAAPAQTTPSDLEAAKERLQQNSAALTKAPLDRSVEPAFHFQA